MLIAARSSGAPTCLFGNGERNQIQQGSAKECRRVLAHSPARGVDDDNGPITQPRGWVQCRHGLADDQSRGGAAFKPMNFGMARTGMRKSELLALTIDAVVQIGSAYWLRIPLGKPHNSSASQPFARWM
jgi:hypothetical protein